MRSDDGRPRAATAVRLGGTPVDAPWRGAAPARAAPARQGSLREHNLQVVLARVVDADPPPSRADIAAATGLTRSAVSALVDRLITAGLVAELAPVPPQRAGRPAVPLVPARRAFAALGAEVNVDYVGVLALDLAGDVLARRQVWGDFRGSDPVTVLARLAAVVEELLAELVAEPAPGGPPRIAGMGLALPGLVDRVTGPLRLAPNLGWRDVDVVAILGTHAPLTGIAIGLANEANLAARAEARTAGADRSFLYVSGEVGIGAAIVLDGEVFFGQHGWSGELGHTVVDPAGPRCSCGSTGCLEQYAGKDALLRSAGLDVALPIEALRAAAHAGDPGAVAALATGGRALGIAIANFVNLVDVEQIVLGGIYAPLVDHLAPLVTEELGTRVLAAPWKQAGVRAARSRQDAAMTGAALTVLSTILTDPAAWVPFDAPPPELG
ncbi:ROK family transcriptional regulator [Cellulomonas fimi]|uniref:ROK family transcriptional regulator n=1 Tax=Cellulomonas fimi TaxID=1708 RepID=A0A7Y0LWU0_CELFI|nr:ROK family transcriptional regulator [Cellulomonas fimi]NMR19279.1 ROK family transcriptional regulator [Cellulomonas fimi]